MTYDMEHVFICLFFTCVSSLMRSVLRFLAYFLIGFSYGWVFSSLYILNVVVQLLSCFQLFVSSWTAACQASLSITSSRACSNSCLSNQWCHPTISSSVAPFSSCPHSFTASGSSPVSQLFTSGGESNGPSASASLLPMNIHSWFPLGWNGWISLQSKRLSRVFSNITVQKHWSFSAQPSLWSNSHIRTWLLEKPLLWLDEPLLAK